MAKSKKPAIRLLQGDRLLRAALPAGFARMDDHGDNCGHNHGAQPSLEGQTCRRHVIVLPGTGRKEFPLPNPEELIEVCIEFIHEAARVQRARSRARTGASDARARKTASQAVRNITLESISVFPGLDKSAPQAGLGMPGTLRKSLSGIFMRAHGGDGAAEISNINVRPHKIIPVIDETAGNKNGATLWGAAGGLASVMHDGRFEAHIAEVFDPHIGAVDWARKHMAPKYQPTVESLAMHFGKLMQLYRESLPSVMHALAAQYRDASEDQLIDAAVSIINRQLAEILYILAIWTDSFAQQRDGKYSQLLHVVFTLEQCFRLFTTGDPKGGCDADCQEKVKNQTLHVGDVFMARFGPNGPATIPGARGPVGAHAIEVPHDEREIIALMLPVYLHEFRHDYYADVVGLPEQMAAAVIAAIDKAAAEGKFNFKSDTINLGGQKVPTLALLKQIIVQTLSETDADIGGGMLLNGPAFLYSLIAVFSAFNAKGQDIFKVNRLLRSSSRFGVSEEDELVIAPHMPDYPRAFFAAAALDCIGFTAEADECRTLATQAAGEPVPTVVTWSNNDPESKFKFKIQIPFADLIQLAPVVADAIINSKLECLGGLSTGQLVNWTRHRQEKVDILTRLLMEGKSEIPADMGDVFAPMVSAAAITAYWGLVKSGRRPAIAIPLVEGAARKMLDQVRMRFNEPRPVDPEEVTVAKPADSK